MAVDTAPKIRSKRLLGGKIETTTGTPISLSAADAPDFVYDPTLQYNTGVIDIPAHGGFLDGRGIRTAKRSATASFSVELRGDGSAPPDWFKYMQACGMTLSSATLTPLSAPVTTLTIGMNQDGRFRSMSGAMGTWEMTLTAGAPGMVKFDFTGVQQPMIDEAIWAPTYNSVIPPNVSAATISIFSGTYRVPSITITANNKVILREDVNATDSGSTPTGYRAAMIVGRRYQVRISPEALPLSTRNWKTIFDSGTTSALSVVVGTATNNIFTITAPVMRLAEEPNDTDRDGLLVDDLVFDLLPSTGDDAIQIVNS